MTYEETIQYLFRQLPMYQKVGQTAFKKGLGNITALCDLLGNPQNSYPTIHIAGTNGKGSTAHMMAAILQASGLKVGLYTSPHYKDFRERIKINGVYITKQAVIDFVGKNKEDFQEIYPSYFEMTVAMAFDYFKNSRVDIAVIETGLGGKDDSTNIITPILSIITNVSYDHTNILGNTLGEIATTKSGIIKPNVSVVIGEEHQETKAIFIKKAKEMNAPISFAEQIYQVKKLSGNFRKTTFDVFNNNDLAFHQLDLELFGDYQSKNLVTTLASVQVLNSFTHLEISQKKLIQGLAKAKTLTRMIGRWDILQEKPLILADSGHNEVGIQAIVKELKTIPCRQLRIVFGVVRDKDLDKILALLPKDAIYYFVQPNVQRGLKSSELQKRANDIGLKGENHSSVSGGVHAALFEASDDDLIFVGGSSFVVGEVV